MGNKTNKPSKQLSDSVEAPQEDENAGENSASIHRLYKELWKLILPLLNLSDVTKLITVGNPQLAAKVSQSVQCVRWTHPGPYIDLDAFMSLCNRLQRTKDGASSLREIFLEPVDHYMVVKTPIQPIVFPQTVTSLSLHFAQVFTAVLPLDLKQLLPHLLCLSLKGVQSSQFELEALQLPPHLESLTLSSESTYPRILPKWLSSLPRALQSLSLQGIWEPLDLKSGNLGRNEAPIVWPPSLTHLALFSRDDVPIEHLPRTVTSLDLRGSDIITAFPELDEKIVFPWRRFFPYLYRIKLPALRSRYGHHVELLIRTIVLDDVLEASTVDSFIASGFWDLPSLRHLQTEFGRRKDPYPLFKHIEFHERTYVDIPSAILMSELEALSPQLKNVDFGCIPVLHTDLLPFIAATTWLDLTMHLPKTPVSIPPSVTAISARTMDLSSATPNLLKIDCSHLRARGEPIGPGDSFPPKLTSLSTNYFDGPLECAEGLPISLTYLHLGISSPEAWTVIAERLLNLRTLKLSISQVWTSEEPLAKISSSHLEEVCLDVSSAIAYPYRPKLGGFFVQPSPFPSSLKSLQLQHSFSWWHSSVLAALPPNLTSLDIDQINWDPQQGHDTDGGISAAPYPGTEGMDAAALIKCMSPKLRSLRIAGSRAAPQIKTLRHLPPSITKLILGGFLGEESDWKAVLPRFVYNGGVRTLFVPVTVIRPVGFLN